MTCNHFVMFVLNHGRFLWPSDNFLSLSSFYSAVNEVINWQATDIGWQTGAPRRSAMVIRREWVSRRSSSVGVGSTPQPSRHRVGNCPEKGPYLLLPPSCSFKPRNGQRETSLLMFFGRSTQSNLAQFIIS